MRARTSIVMPAFEEGDAIVAVLNRIRECMEIPHEMLIVVDPQSGVPVYRQLMDQVKFHITSGLLEPGDLLVGNDTRVMAARLYARRPTGGRVEFLVLDPGADAVRALARPARKLQAGDVLELEGGGDRDDPQR